MGLATTVATLGFSAPALAQWDPHLAIDVLATPPSYSGCASFDLEALGCGDGWAPVGGDTFVWVYVITDGFPDGIAGTQFGLEHLMMLGSSAWTLCSGGAEIPQETPIPWPESGSGNAVTWPGGCYIPDGETAKIGYFFVPGPSAGCVDVTRDPRLGDGERIVYTDCGLINYSGEGLGRQDVREGGTLPCGPFGDIGDPFNDGVACEPIPTKSVAWGAIKSLF